MELLRGWSGFWLGLAVTMVAGCAEGGGYDGLDDVRAGGETNDFWNLRPDDPGNGDVDLLDDGDDNGLPDTIIWCLGGDGEGTDVFDATYDLTAFTSENQIFDAAGNLGCTAYAEDGLFKLREGLDGPVVLTASPGRYVFAGDVAQLPEPGSYDWYALLVHQLEFEFYGDVLYEGPRWNADVIGYATEHLHRASPMRKLLVAALYDGLCGTDTPTN